MLFVVLMISGITGLARQHVVPYTLADQDKLIQEEANVNSLHNEINSLRNEMNAKFDAVDVNLDSVNSRFDDILWILRALFVMMMFMSGFII